MFISRSAARVRLARLLFFCLVLCPSAIVAGWAAHLRSDGHRDVVRRAWERALGLPVRLGRVDHPRPGVVRIDALIIGEPDGPAQVTLPGAEIETSASEVRLRIARLRCDASAARLLATMAGDWLARGPRFDRNCVIEVEDFDWAAVVTPAGEPHVSKHAPAGLLIECVATTEARAIRAVRRAAAERPSSAGSDTHDGSDAGETGEMRIVRSLAGVGVSDTPDAVANARIDLVGAWQDPVPFPVIAALASGTSLRDWTFGQAATVAGRVEMSCGEQGWQGAMTGRIEHVDLAAFGAALHVPAAGSGVIDVRSLAWSAGRLADCELECRIGRGGIASSFLESLVGMLGCRPGEALAATARGGVIAFDAAGALMRIHGGGFELMAAPRLGGALALAAGQPVVWPPAGAVAVERLAWLLVPPRTPYVPAAGPGAWLLSIMPAAANADMRGAREPPHAARREF